MESLNNGPILEFHPDTLNIVRKMFDLDGPDRMTEAVDAFEEWVKKQRHFKKKDFSRDYLERIIITRKGFIERSKARLDKLCTLRTLMPQFFGHCNVKTDLNNLDDAKDVMLPKLTSDQYRVYLIKNHGKHFTSSFFSNFYKRLFVLAEYYNAHDYAAGVITIADFMDLNIVEYVMKINPVELHQAMTILIEGYGSRLKGFHIVTRSKTIDTLISLFKQVLSAKIASRIHVHKSFEPVYEFVEKDILPMDYGGKEISVDELHEKWLNELSTEEHMDYIQMMSTAGTDESHRPRDTFNNQYLGMPGTFRTLRVD